MTLSHAEPGPRAAGDCHTIEERYFEQFRSLHPRLVPNTYFTAQQILNGWAQTRIC